MNQAKFYKKKKKTEMFVMTKILLKRFPSLRCLE